MLPSADAGKSISPELAYPGDRVLSRNVEAREDEAAHYQRPAARPEIADNLGFLPGVCVQGHDPSRHIIGVSYGADLAVKLGNDFRAIVNSGWYRRLFPWMQVSRVKNTELEVLTSVTRLSSRGPRSTGR